MAEIIAEAASLFRITLVSFGISAFTVESRQTVTGGSLLAGRMKGANAVIVASG
jgi:hypothetical protein